MDRQMLEREKKRQAKLLIEQAAATKQSAERAVQRARELQDRLAKLQPKLRAAAKARTISRLLRSTL